MKKSAIIFILILSGWVLCGNSFAAAMDRLAARGIFDNANALYKQNKYVEAAVEYKKILLAGFTSGNLYYNLGNAYFKLGRIGEAVLNYERAAGFIPADGDLKSNYDYAQSVLNLDKQDFAGNRMVVWLARAFSGLGIDSLALFLSALYATIFFILILSLFFSWAKKLAKPLLFILTILFVLCAVSLNRKITCLERGAIILSSSQAEAKFEPLENATTYFTLKEGSKVLVLESSGNWYKIERSDAKLGWVQKSALGLLSDNSIP